jgi:hypothetical protein
LEERVRQLRELGVGAVAVAAGSEGLMGEKMKQEKATAAVVRAGKESDEESLYSDSFYSARSSFSSVRSGVGEL